MMEPALLQTKLYIPPPRPDLVARSRLIKRLNRGLHHKLTLVSAPAGFGKTTLVGEWMHMLKAPRDGVGTSHEASPKVAWLSLDEDDNAPTRFLAYAVAALQTVEADLGKGVLGALQSSQPPSNEESLRAASWYTGYSEID